MTYWVNDDYPSILDEYPDSDIMDTEDMLDIVDNHDDWEDADIDPEPVDLYMGDIDYNQPEWG